MSQVCQHDTCNLIRQTYGKAACTTNLQGVIDKSNLHRGVGQSAVAPKFVEEQCVGAGKVQDCQSDYDVHSNVGCMVHIAGYCVVKRLMLCNAGVALYKTA